MKIIRISKYLVSFILLALVWLASPAGPHARAESEASWPNIEIQLSASGFQRPVDITHANNGSNKLFVVEQAGFIRILNPDGSISPIPFLNISDRVRSPVNGGGNEEGLLGLAFPPSFDMKKHFFVYYTNLGGDNLVARFSLAVEPDQADPTSEKKIILFEHPGETNHNGGQIAFGEDGYLYIGTGDGGGGGDPNGNAQNPASLLGKMLRIDVEITIQTSDYSTYLPCMQKTGGTSLPASYRIPADNPFVNTPGYRPEIWALGLRNPWRFSFDRQTHDLYIADVGQGEIEEIDFQSSASTGGENYGWNIMEGSLCYKNASCDTTGLVLPVVEYDHSQGCSVTGGSMYRGTAYPNLQGIYLYADFCSGKVWGLQNDGNWESQLLLESGLMISTFGEGENGEQYAADLASGNIYKITAVVR